MAENESQCCQYIKLCLQVIMLEPGCVCVSTGLFFMLQAHYDRRSMFSLDVLGDKYIVQYLSRVTALKCPLFCTF